MLVGHFLSLRETMNQQVKLLERHLCHDEMLTTMKELVVLVRLMAPSRGHKSSHQGTRRGCGEHHEAAGGSGQAPLVPHAE